MIVLLHFDQQVAAGHVAEDFVGFRKQGTFLRQVAHVAREKVAVADALSDLLRGQAFRNGEGVQVLLAADERVDHVAQARVLLEEKLAGLHLGPFPLGREHHVHRHRAVDHAFGVKLLDDVRQVGMWDDVDDLVGGERSRLVQPAIDPSQSREGCDGNNDQERNEAAHRGQGRPAAARRLGRRRRRRFRLKSLVRALRRHLSTETVQHHGTATCVTDESRYAAIATSSRRTTFSSKPFVAARLLVNPAGSPLY